MTSANDSPHGKEVHWIVRVRAGPQSAAEADGQETVGLGLAPAAGVLVGRS